MKYFKVYAKCCKVPDHVEDITHKVSEEVEKGINKILGEWSECHEFDHDEKRVKLEAGFIRYGFLLCGDYEIVALNNEGTPEVPNMIGWEVYDG